MIFNIVQLVFSFTCHLHHFVLLFRNTIKYRLSLISLPQISASNSQDSSYKVPQALLIVVLVVVFPKISLCALTGEDRLSVGP